jgi:site-specific recombinase XerD
MVSFYLRGKTRDLTTINCAIQIRGQKRIVFPISNLKVSPSQWSNGRMITGKGRQENGRIQHQLEGIYKNLVDFIREYNSRYKKYPNRKDIIDYISSNKTLHEYFDRNEKMKILELFDIIIKRRVGGFELTDKKKRFSYQSITLYNSTRKVIEEFQKHKKKKFLYVHEFESATLIEELEIFMTIDLEMMVNTIANKMKTLKSFLQIAWSENIIGFNPFKKHNIVIYTEETDAVIFTEDEMVELENLDLSDDEYLGRVRDQYLIYLWSGIRKSDLPNLLSVINSNSEYFTFRSGKTGELCTIPAFDTLKRVAEKYNYQFPSPIHDVVILRKIKEICKRIISMNVIVEKNYTKGGKRKRELKKKYQMIHIHTGRRTLATQLVKYGLPYEQVMKITGHKKLTTLQKYIKSGINVEQMLEVGNRIGKQKQ